MIDVVVAIVINLAIAGAVVVVAVVVVAVVHLLQFVLGGRNTHVDSSALSVQLLNQNFRTRIGRLPSTGSCARNR